MANGSVNTPGAGVAKEATSQDILTAVTTASGKVDQNLTVSRAILEAVGGSTVKRYGYRVKIGESDSYNRVEYLYDAVGMKPAKMNYDTGVFDFGDWEDIWFVRDNYPCMLNPDGSVAYQLSKTDHAYRADGVTPSDVANTSSDLNAMSAIPCVWYKQYTNGGYYYFVCCEEQYDSTFYADVHTNSAGEVKDYKYTAMYEGSLISSVLRSLSGQRPESSTTAAAELAAAEANGDEWCIGEHGVHMLISNLLVLMGKSCNSEAVYGQGHIEGGSSASNFLTTGTLDQKGQFFGYNSTGSAMKVFFIENYWGDRWDRMQGLVSYYGTIRAKVNSNGDGYNWTGDGYTSIGVLFTSTGYVVAMRAFREGVFPASVGGSASTYETDQNWMDTSIIAVAIFGGHCSAGASCGARCVGLNSAVSNASWTVGASLSLKEPS